jgi:hypothetical protein
MSDEDYDDSDEQDAADVRLQEPDRDSKVMRELRKRAKEADKLEAELAVIRREAAFDKARLPDDVPGIKFFRDNYKGDLTPEAIAEAAAQHGFIQPATDVTADRAAQQRIAQSAAGVTDVPPADYTVGMREAASKAPPGQEGQAIADYLRSIGRPVAG